MSTTSFLPPIVIATSSDLALAVDDVNGDGNPDIVTTAIGGSTVSVYLGQGDGTFALPATYSNGGGSYLFVDIADLNDDGALDIIVPNTFTSVGVLLNNGDGTFGSAVSYSAGPGAAGVAVGDLNGDGKIDVVTANQGTSNISVLLGNGDGTLGSNVEYPVLFGSVPIGIADLNLDGMPDLVVGDNHSNAISVLLGDGSGTFPTRTDYTAFAGGGSPIDLAIADFNGDGTLDIAASNQVPGTNEISVFLNNGDGSFAAPTQVSVVNPFGLTAVEMNGDGNSDLVVHSSGVGIILLLSNGDGTFSAGPTYADPGAGYVATSDINLDGIVDIIFSNNLSVMLGEATNGPPTITSDGGSSTAAVAIVENTAAVTIVTADDPDAGQTLKFSMAGGDDVALFEINETTGALSFLTAPDFEAPIDADSNNTYEVVVQVSDGAGGTDTQTLAVTITNLVGETWVGGNGGQTHIGTGEEDILTGGNGKDTFDGGGGNDSLFGGNGKDVLTGGTGNDSMTGGNGADTFVFAAGFGNDVIADFAKDVIQFDHTLFANFAAVKAHAAQVGVNTVITYDADNTVTLIGVARTSLDAGDFQFV